MSAYGETEQVIQRLRELSKAAVGLASMDYRSEISVPLLGDFYTNIDPKVVERVAERQAAMFKVMGQPELVEMIDLDAGYRPAQVTLLKTILPPIALELMNASQQHVEEVRNLQDAESSRRFDTLQGEYLAVGGDPLHRGFLRWGVIDIEHTLPNWEGQIRTGVTFGLEMATILPHVRYSCEFSGNMDGTGATIKQELLVKGQTAMMTRGFEKWYRSLDARTPRLLNGTGQ